MSETNPMPEASAKRRREIETRARELYVDAQALLEAAGDLVPAELAAPGSYEQLKPVMDRVAKVVGTFGLLRQAVRTEAES